MKLDHTIARVHSIQGQKTTKYENESENEVRCCHKFAPVSRLTHTPAKIKRGSFWCPYSNLERFCIAVHRHTNSKDTGHKTKLGLRSPFRRTQKAFLSYFSHKFTGKFQSLCFECNFFITVKHLPFFCRSCFN